MAKFLSFLAGRIGAALATTVVGALCVFMVMKAAPGDPALRALGEYATPDAVAAFHTKWHLDDPIILQFGYWVEGIFRGDFGRSLTIAGGVPIQKLIALRLPSTLFLGLYAVALALLVSLSMGTVAALRRGKLADTLATTIAVVGVSMPDFWLSYVLILAFSLGLGWLPAYGFVSPFDSIGEAFYTGFLPAVAIAAPMAAVFTRTLRTTLLETARREYVTVARSFGFGGAFIFLHYVFRNAIIPYVVVVGLQIRYLLGGIVVIERVFGVPGVGSLMVDAAFARDYPVVQACAITFLAIVMLVNLTVDIVCASLDPRRTN